LSLTGLDPRMPTSCTHGPVQPPARPIRCCRDLRRLSTLYYGDNLDVLQRHVKDEPIDLVYLDPPFNSNATYNVLFHKHDDTPAPSQIEAFGDTWHWDQVAGEAFIEASDRAWEAVITIDPSWEQDAS
jgi:hypothetical protein